MREQDYTVLLRRVGYGVWSLFQQDHKAVRYRSRLWYALPILLSLIGGIVAYFAIRYDDPDKAKNCLLVGMLMFAPWVVAGIISLAINAAVTAD